MGFIFEKVSCCAVWFVIFAKVGKDKRGHTRSVSYVASREKDRPDFRGEAFRCYVDAASGEQMTKICEQTELGQTELLNKIVRAGLQALHDDGCTITLPLRFAVVREKRAQLA